MPDSLMGQPPEEAPRTAHPHWHAMTAEEVASLLGTDAEHGLSDERAAAVLEEHGRNELAVAETESPFRLFLGQFNDFMIWVLVGAVAISALEGEVADAVAITVILLLNGVLGFVQEYRAERAMDALRELATPEACVIREGREITLPVTDVVPGDVVLLTSGDHVPADGRLVDAAALRVEEAALTGESVPVDKRTDRVPDQRAPLGDRHDMVYAGTAVAVGRGRYLVTATGDDTEVGQIAGLLAKQIEERTPLQEELKTVGKRIAVLVLAIAAAVFLVGVWQALRQAGDGLGAAIESRVFQSHVTESLLIAISLAVAAIPEGLPAIVTVALSLGVRRMAQHNAIVKKLHAVETLGSTTFICSDKTGTLTRNQMALRRLLVGLDQVEVLPDFALRPLAADPHAEDLAMLMQASASVNDARFDAEGRAIGDPTETALLVAADALARGRLQPRRVSEVPFDSERKRMTTVHERTFDGTSERIAYMKGGPDVVLGLCDSALLRGNVTPLDDDLRLRILEATERLAAEGFRTLAVASRKLDAETTPEDIEHSMTYLGITGLLDPPRAEVPGAIATCKAAGIRVAMVTGDHALTAVAVGREVGLLDGDGPTIVVTGRELEEMSDDELYRRAEDIRIYARVDPEHKLRIVDALKRHGHVVAMTGDGVNDAPALKRADIGVAMGDQGTDVSREAADMVLADDDFATIVDAVREGRMVFDNLRKFILFLLSCNISEVAIVFTTALLAQKPALLPLQLLWINLITDGLPALALGVDPPAPDLMLRKPRASEESILSRRRQFQVWWQGLFLAVSGLLIYWYAEKVLNAPMALEQTMLFSTIVLAQLLHALDLRSETRSVFSAESLRNRWLLAAIAGSVTLQLVVIYTPALQRVFGTAPLTAAEWGPVLLAALVPITLIDLFKMIAARRSGPTPDERARRVYLR